MRFEVQYRTSFQYDGPVVESQNELRVCPTSDGDQQVLHYRITTEPSSRTISYVDYWGTHVDVFGLRTPHDGLVVNAEATVDTMDRPAPTRGATMVDLAAPAFRDAHFEFGQATRRTPALPAVTDAARDLLTGVADGDVVGVVEAVHAFVGDHLVYTPGATEVGTTLDEVLERRAGVCQDYAHLAVALCRSLGIPARYVSGYLFTPGVDQDESATEVVVKTHAWFEAAVPGSGWLALDPTNKQAVGALHIVIGRGRDYDDVAPMRGTYVGPDTATHDVEVRLRRLTMAEQQQQQQQQQ